MKTMHLTLKKKWFDMIASGEKKEEYREIKPYWVKRLLWLFDEMDSLEIDELTNDLKNPIRFKNYDEIYRHFVCDTAYFKTVTFTNGYASNAPRMVIESKGIEIKEGNPDWGAEPGKHYFVISLGNIISITPQPINIT